MSVDHKFQHFVITPYFVRLNENMQVSTSNFGPQADWLDNRLSLFVKYCLPSVMAQSDKNFRWMLWLDEDTPKDYLNKLRSIVSRYENILMITCKFFTKELLVDTIKLHLDPDTSWVLTTRLDNDDGWHRDFIRVIHDNLSFERREFMNHPVGLLYYRDRAYLYRHDSNAFISFLEPRDEFTTVWCAPHPYLARVAPVRQLPAFPAFLQAVHGQNLSNKPRGVRIHKLLGLRGFEAMTALFDDRQDREKDLDIVLDNLISVPIWAARDLAIGMARNAIRRLAPTSP